MAHLTRQIYAGKPAKEMYIMLGENNNIVMPTGNKNKSGVNGIEHMEKQLHKAVIQHIKPLQYDELCRKDGVSRIKAIRCDDGKIDVLATFMKVRNMRKGAPVDSF